MHWMGAAVSPLIIPLLASDQSAVIATGFLHGGCTGSAYEDRVENT